MGSDLRPALEGSCTGVLNYRRVTCLDALDLAFTLQLYDECEGQLRDLSLLLGAERLSCSHGCGGDRGTAVPVLLLTSSSIRAVYVGISHRVWLEKSCLQF